MTATSVIDAKLEDAPSGRRNDIQGLRAIAVGIVVLSHMGLPGFGGGFIGVDVFFVISGFLITGLLLNEARKDKAVSLAGFYSRRALRILPMSTLVLLSTVAAAYYVFGRVRAQETFNDSLWAMLFAANWKFSTAGTDYFNDELPASPLQHYWSLAIEEQFYVVWPALIGVLVLGLAAFGKASKGARLEERRVDLALLVIFVIGAASLAFSVAYTSSQPTASYFSTFSRVWELASGAALALAAARLARLPGAVRAFAGWTGLFGIALSVAVIKEGSPFPGSIALLPVLSTVLIIVAGLRSTAVGPQMLLGLAPLRWLGDRSYSLYLWHWPILILAPAYAGQDLSVLQNAGLMLGALALSDVTYRLIERPIQNRAKTVSYSTGLLLWPATVTCLMVVVLLGTSSLRTAELVARSTDQVQAAAAEPTAPSERADLTPMEAAVIAALQPSALDVGVPASVEPPLSEVRDDIWRGDEILAEDCFANPGKTSSRICPVGPENGRKVVLVGDSQGGMWWPAVRVLAEQRGWRAYPLIKTACSPADRLSWKEQKDAPDEECQQWRSWALAEVEKIKPDLTLVSSRLYRQVGDDGQPFRLDDAKNVAAWQEGMTSTLAKLKQHSTRVLQFSDSPRVEEPLECLDARDATLAGCAFPYPGLSGQTSQANQKAAEAAGAQYLDLTSWFCAGNRCPSVIDNVVVYFTDGHVTRTFAERAATHLGDAFGPV